MDTPIRTSVIKIGEHRGNPRIYLQGKWLGRAHFTPNQAFSVRIDSGTLIIEADPDGDRKVCKRGQDTSVIDINHPLIGEAFRVADQIEVKAFHGSIVITKARTDKQKASRVLTVTAVAVFAGGGLLCQAARQAGFNTAAAVEIDPAYADIWQANHPGQVLNMSVTEVNEGHLAPYRPVGLMTIGLPCEPYSTVRRAAPGSLTKADRTLPPESHAETGDMFFWALRLIDMANPHTVVLENVPGFLNAAAGIVTLRVLERMGYTVDAQVIDPLDHGEISSRKRAVVVATAFDRVRWPRPCPVQRRVGEILLPADHPDCQWFNESTKPWFFEHRRRHVAKGNSFNFQIIRPDSPYVAAITRRYLNQQPTNPVVAHPTLPDTYRWLTIREIRRIQGLPEDFLLDDCMSTVGEVLGQGVLVGLFEKIIRSVTGVGEMAAERKTA